VKNILLFLLSGIVLSACAMSAADLSVGNTYANYEKSCRKVSLMKPKLVYNDGKIQGYHCQDAAGADIWRYEFFENGRLVKVHSRPVTAEERNQRFQMGLLGLAIMNSGTPSTNTSIGTVAPTRIFSFDIPSGVNTVCFYNQTGGMYSHTIPRGQICPRILN
tara:strand:- start:310 stop:795 length:486 start_codon:yes stop_codon:yes gene_type:complete